MLQHQGENPTVIICSTNSTEVSLRGHRREVPPANWQERAHSCHPSTVKRGPKGTQRYPQNTIFLLMGRRIR
ncbi:hypothetical protein TNCV_776001 [Trichonephila clavipes]|nr:hypothetical protein TNCV_776001 [Trichonephila clavipes]